jgi:hypothetical protein
VLLVILYIIPVTVLTFTYSVITRELWYSGHIGEHINLDQLAAKKKVRINKAKLYEH